MNLAFAAPAAILLGLLSLYPIVLLVRLSVSDVGAQELLGYWPFTGLDNFTAIFADPVFWTVATQTLIFVVAVLVATLVLGFIAAMLLRRTTRFHGTTLTLMIFVWALPPVVVGSLWRFMLSSNGPVNAVLGALHLIDRPVAFLSQPITSLASIAVVTLWVGVPFATLVLKSAILDIPVEIWDAAEVDGAGHRQTVWYIVLPAIRPTLYILSVLSVMHAFKGFDFIYVMTKGGPGTSSSTIPFLGYLTAFQDYQFGRASAISVVAMLVVLLLSVAYMLSVRGEDR